MTEYKFFFKRYVDRIDGLLTFQDKNAKPVFQRVPSRSGQSGYTDTSWVRGMSPIPLGKHYLFLNPLNKGLRADDNGIGLFFPIGSRKNSTTIWSINRFAKRTAIGLHEENTKPGSAGCVVVLTNQEELEQEWLEMCDFLQKLSKDSRFLEFHVIM